MNNTDHSILQISTHGFRIWKQIVNNEELPGS